MRNVNAVSFDQIDHWHDEFGSAICDLLPEDYLPLLLSRKPEYFEDAASFLLDRSDRDAVVDASLRWIDSKVILAYHGTRLTEDELSSVRSRGLVPLDFTSRRPRLERALSNHPRWSEVAHLLDDCIEEVGPGWKFGSRGGQVHLTLSRNGLLKGFKHYLCGGSEFDQRVAECILGESGLDLLSKDGSPYLVEVGVPGSIALNAAHPHFSILDVRSMGDLPNIACHFIRAWAWRLTEPEYTPEQWPIDCGLVFRNAIPPDWIVDINHCPINE
jgi:hypothetical protein